MKIPTTIAAQEVQKGDYLPGLDNGYVIDVESDPDIRDEYNIGIGHGMVAITFNTNSGDEGFLVVPPDMPMTVQKEII